MDILSTPRFEPTTFRLPRGLLFLAQIRMSLVNLPLLGAGTMKDLAEVIKTITAFIGNITQSLYIEHIMLVLNGLAYSPL